MNGKKKKKRCENKNYYRLVSHEWLFFFFIRTKTHFGWCYNARWQPRVSQMICIYFRWMCRWFQTQSFPHRCHLLLVNRMRFARTFARLTCFPKNRMIQKTRHWHEYVLCCVPVHCTRVTSILLRNKVLSLLYIINECSRCIRYLPFEKKKQKFSQRQREHLFVVNFNKVDTSRIVVLQTENKAE